MFVFFAHLLQKTFLLFLSTTLWGVDCERKNSAYVASSSLQRFHTCSVCKIMFGMSMTTSSLMFTWILLETGEATKREGKRKRQDPLCNRREEEKIQGLSGRISFWLISIDQPSNLQAKKSTPHAVSLAAPVSTFKGSWWQLGRGDR